MGAIPVNPYTPGATNDAASHNAAIGPTNVAVNNHNHNASDPINGQGGPIDASSSAIPANASETIAYPSSGASYIPIVSTQGIEIEIARVRGQLARLTGGNWYDNIGAALHYDAGSSNLTIAGIMSASQLTSTVAVGTAPLIVTSTTKVTNLNADLLDSASAVDSATTTNPTSFAGAIAIHDHNGYLPQGLIYYDSVEAATMDTLVANSTSQISNLNRIRGVLSAINIASGMTAWNTPPATLVASLGTFGGIPRGGATWFKSGNGTLIYEESPGVFRVDATGVAQAAQGGLTYADLFNDAVISGLTPTAGGGFAVNIAPGHAYVAGGYRGLVNTTAVTVPPSQTTYIFWDGGPAASNFQQNITGVAPVGTIPIAKAVANGSSITSLVDLRVVGALFNNHIFVTGPKPANPTIVGNNITSATVDATSNDVRGSITMVTGNGTSSTGTQITLNFANPYPGNIYVVIEESITPATDFQVIKNYVNGTCTGFSISLAVAPANNTTFGLDYIVLG